MTPRLMLKRFIQAIALVLSLLPALSSGFGRARGLFVFFAQLYALVPDKPGMFLRAAYYRLTLSDCSIDVAIGFGTVFVHPGAALKQFVSIGSFCIIGRAQIGERTQISSGVQIPSGRHQHSRDTRGVLQDSAKESVVIGMNCWIGASTVIMASVGDGATIGAGSIVVNPIPPGSVAVGNPARVQQKAETKTV